MCKMHIFFLEGNVGAGKSTILNHLKQEFPDDLTTVPEPVALWEESGLLAEMYDGRLSRATFQFVALITKMSSLLDAIRSCKTSVILVERSPYSDLEIFAEGTLEQTDLIAYKLAHKQLIKEFEREAGDAKKTFVFLENLTISQLIGRIRKRNRNGESRVDEDFLRMLDARHRRMRHHSQHDCVTLDASLPEAEVLAKARTIVTTA